MDVGDHGALPFAGQRSAASLSGAGAFSRALYSGWPSSRGTGARSASARPAARAAHRITQCYLGSDLLNIVDDLTPAHMVPSVSNGGAGGNNRHLPRTVLSPPRLWNCRQANHSGSSPIVCQTGGLRDADIIAYLYSLSARVSIAWAAISTRPQALDAKLVAFVFGSQATARISAAPALRWSR